jgi:hypothetical protein
MNAAGEEVVQSKALDGFDHAGQVKMIRILMLAW